MLRMRHAEITALRERPQAPRIALVVEGGGMRGAGSGGMALGLHELRLADAFDAACERFSRGLFAAMLAGRTELHPLATDVASGASVDLHDQIVDEPSLRRALCASAPLPLLAGPPVRFDGRRLLDAGLSAAIPFRAAIADGATHVVVLPSRHDADPALEPAVLSIRPAPGSSAPSRLERDVAVISAGLEAGRAAAHAVRGR
jgi:predicted patatin/cPLA2 family phospholipase